MKVVLGIAWLKMNKPNWKDLSPARSNRCRKPAKHDPLTMAKTTYAVRCGSLGDPGVWFRVMPISGLLPDHDILESVAGLVYEAELAPDQVTIRPIQEVRG